MGAGAVCAAEHKLPLIAPVFPVDNRVVFNIIGLLPGQNVPQVVQPGTCQEPCPVFFRNDGFGVAGNGVGIAVVPMGPVGKL